MTALETDPSRRTPARLAGRAILACQSDERLVVLVRSGHERAFEAIVARYRRPLERWCGRILPQSRIEDAVQQTFINAHAALTDTGDAVQLKPWLYTIARNASLNMARQNGWDCDEVPANFDGVPRPDQVLEQKLELRRTVDAINDLPERQRSALVMRELEGRSYAEIAVALGAGEGAVRQLLNRARDTVRAAASALLPPPVVLRAAASMPGDGRRVAEVAAGLGAAGVAKAGATALVAGSLVVGAVKAPLPIGGGGKSKREPVELKADGHARDKAAAPGQVRGLDAIPAADRQRRRERGSDDRREGGSHGRRSGRSESWGPGGGSRTRESTRSGSGTGGGEHEDRSGPSAPDDGAIEGQDSSGPGSGSDDVLEASSGTSGPDSGPSDLLEVDSGSGSDDTSLSGSGSTGSDYSESGTSGSSD